MAPSTQAQKAVRVRAPHLSSRLRSLYSPERSCLMRPLLVVGSTGRKSLNQEISGSGFPPAAHNMVAVRAFSTTFSWGPMSMEGKPGGSWSSADKEQMCCVRARTPLCGWLLPTPRLAGILKILLSPTPDFQAGS